MTLFKVLLVEDSDPVRMVIEKQLRHEGIDVLSAATGEAALEIVNNDADDLEVAILDRVLPGKLDGNALVRSLRKIRPGLGVVQMSGYPRTAGGFSDSDDCDIHLTKPVRRKDLLDALHYVLQSHSTLERVLS